MGEGSTAHRLCHPPPSATDGWLLPPSSSSSSSGSSLAAPVPCPWPAPPRSRRRVLQVVCASSAHQPFHATPAQVNYWGKHSGSRNGLWDTIILKRFPLKLASENILIHLLPSGFIWLKVKPGGLLGAGNFLSWTAPPLPRGFLPVFVGQPGPAAGWLDPPPLDPSPWTQPLEFKAESPQFPPENGMLWQGGWHQNLETVSN